MSALSHLRWIAAWLVAISHVRNLLMEDYNPSVGLIGGAFYFATGFGHAAVVVFFVLSGFLVGAKVRGLARGDDLDRYLLDRGVRIFVVAWPALLLSGAALAVAALVFPASPLVAGAGWSAALQQPLSADIDLWRWLASALMLNGLTSPTPAINGPLWSLAYEWTFYMVAAAVALAIRGKANWLTVYAAGLCILVAANLPGLFGGFAVWGLGLAAGAVSERRWLRSRAALWFGGLLLAAALTAWRLWGLGDMVLGLAVAFAVAHSHWRDWRLLPTAGDRLSGFSYSLYATHFPLAVLCALPLAARLPFSLHGVGIVALTFGAALLFARLFASATEDLTEPLKAWVRRQRYATSSAA